MSKSVKSGLVAAGVALVLWVLLSLAFGLVATEIVILAPIVYAATLGVTILIATLITHSRPKP
ncbi:hypothetical protein [Nonomuraea sediminis]|uniref:hypothetical protein n=1 Tax=Nonomuraea sediminis TaxID=2835864 RepID=UPI001BDD87FD|nr:hypothetical protein [Nonomuraea sediminis]